MPFRQCIGLAASATTSCECIRVDLYKPFNFWSREARDHFERYSWKASVYSWLIATFFSPVICNGSKTCRFVNRFTCFASVSARSLYWRLRTRFNGAHKRQVIRWLVSVNPYICYSLYFIQLLSAMLCGL